VNKFRKSNTKIVIEKRKKLQKDFDNKKKVLDQYLRSAPFTKMSDQLCFLFGVQVVIL
jgi:hypothetical protein